MKFNHLLLLILVLLSVIAFSAQTSVKNKSKMRSRSHARNRLMSAAKRRQSMMEYVNGFFSNSPQGKKKFF